MPSLKTLILVGLLAWGGYFLKHRMHPEASASAQGFVEVPWIDGAQRGQVLLIGPPCADKQREMNATIASLAGEGIPARSTSSFRFANSTTKKIAASRDVFEGDVPIVFINGKAKSKPTTQEIIAEYRHAGK
jgi:hypothetical protein